MLRKVISGGQIGADIAGLKAAKKYGLETGGYMPLGFKTATGYRPEYATEYGLVAMGTSLYPPRTYKNVRESDATIRFAIDFSSPGERCTLRAVSEYQKPFFDVELRRVGTGVEIAGMESVYAIDTVMQFINDHQVEVLNIAGNAYVVIEPLVETFLYSVFLSILG